MKLCKDCKSRGEHSICKFYTDTSNYAEKCKDFESIKLTNGERIRKMTDKELAYFLANIHEPDEDTIVINNKEFFAESEILSWLKEESE